MAKDLFNHTFVVECPRSGFPMDMLRYDACWPESSTDARLIEKTWDADERDALSRRVRITLRTNDRQAPTVARWESFNCKIVEPYDD